MKPLIVLLIAFVVSLLVTRFMVNDYDVALAARIAMSVMLLFTSVAHFAFTKGMTMMIPEFIPYKKTLVYVTGLIEIIAAVCLQITPLRLLTGWFLIVFFILMLPANIHAALKKVDYQKGNHDGNGINYLWFRVPLQILFIAWIYFSSVRI